MKIKGGSKLGAHYYNGGRTSRGNRMLSKLHKGIKVGDIDKAFKEVEAQRTREGKNGS